jgi:hypothetical protein
MSRRTDSGQQFLREWRRLDRSQNGVSFVFSLSCHSMTWCFSVLLFNMRRLLSDDSNVIFNNYSAKFCTDYTNIVCSLNWTNRFAPVGGNPGSAPPKGRFSVFPHGFFGIFKPTVLVYVNRRVQSIRWSSAEVRAFHIERRQIGYKLPFSRGDFGARRVRRHFGTKMRHF